MSPDTYLAKLVPEERPLPILVPVLDLGVTGRDIAELEKRVDEEDADISLWF